MQFYFEIDEFSQPKANPTQKKNIQNWHLGNVFLQQSISHGLGLISYRKPNYQKPNQILRRHPIMSACESF